MQINWDNNTGVTKVLCIKKSGVYGACAKDRID